MSYLLDRKKRRQRFFYSLLAILILLALFYFRTSIWSGLAYVSHTLFRPVLVAGNNVGENFSQAKLLFVSKKTLDQENDNLKSELEEVQAMMRNYNTLLVENLDLKEMLGRSGQGELRPRVLASILSKPSRSPYDTLIIDAGAEEGIKNGNLVFALGDLPIGTIAETYPQSSKVILFSSSGEKTPAVMAGNNIFLEMVGRGGGNFEMIMPRDVVPAVGDQAILPGITPRIIGVVQKIISDSRSPFVKALLVSPVNVQEIKFVQIQIAP
ncbi:MAG: rod shape-determining protein MreC [Candidatus Paceibacterota bacterium]